jgi:stringent starvation protein A
MSLLSGRRSTMILFFDPDSPYSHQVRIVLAEKNITVDLIQYQAAVVACQELAEINPYNSTPTLVDRDLVLYDANIIMEYLDERFPHPSLMPVYPVARAQSRLWMYRIRKDWYKLVDVMMCADNVVAYEQARANLNDSIQSIASVFAEKPFFFSDEFTLVDCCLAALFWRFPKWDISLSDVKTQPLRDYCKRIFAREGFLASLSMAERKMVPYYS